MRREYSILTELSSQIPGYRWEPHELQPVYVAECRGGFDEPHFRLCFGISDIARQSSGRMTDSMSGALRVC